MIQELLYDLLVAVLILLGTYATRFIHKKAQEVMLKTDSEFTDKYIEKVANTIAVCVRATQQTYVESLKKEGLFDKEAQVEAFNRTYENVINILGIEAIDYLQTIVGDVETYLTEKIECEVNLQK